MARPHSATGGPTGSQVRSQSRIYAMLSRKWDMKNRRLRSCFPIACQVGFKVRCLTSRRRNSWNKLSMPQIPRWYLTCAKFNRRMMQNITIRHRPSTTKHLTSSFTDRPLSTNSRGLKKSRLEFSCLTFRRLSSGQIRYTVIQLIHKRPLSHSLFSVRHCPTHYLEHLN